MVLVLLLTLPWGSNSYLNTGGLGDSPGGDDSAGRCPGLKNMAIMVNAKCDYCNWSQRPYSLTSDVRLTQMLLLTVRETMSIEAFSLSLLREGINSQGVLWNTSQGVVGGRKWGKASLPWYPARVISLALDSHQSIKSSPNDADSGPRGELTQCCWWQKGMASI